MKIEINKEYIGEILSKGPDIYLEEINMKELIQYLDNNCINELDVLGKLLNMYSHNSTSYVLLSGIIIGQQMLQKKIEEKELEKIHNLV